MILTIFSWTCTMCGHGESYDPECEEAPETCPACGEGAGSFYNTISQVDPDEESYFEVMEQGDPQGWAEDNLRKIAAEDEIEDFLQNGFQKDE